MVYRIKTPSHVGQNLGDKKLNLKFGWGILLLLKVFIPLGIKYVVDYT
jgi:hypothetical protein